MTGAQVGERVAILEGLVARLQKELVSQNRKLSGVCAALSEQHSAMQADRERMAQLEQELAELRGEAVGVYANGSSYAEAN